MVEAVILTCRWVGVRGPPQMTLSSGTLWWWPAQESRCSENPEGFYVVQYHLCRAILGLMWLESLSVVIIPPPVTAVLSADAELNPTQRDKHIAVIADKGRLAWQAETGYGQRALVETTMGRYKGIIGPKLRARSPVGQRAEAAAGVAVLNRMFSAGRPNSVRKSALSS